MSIVTQNRALITIQEEFRRPHENWKSLHLVPIFGFRAICCRVSRGTLEERSSTATPLVATHQDVSLGPIIGGVLYSWRYGYAYISVSRSSVTSHIMANTTCRKTLCDQTFGKPYLIVLYRKTPCNLHLRETLCNRII